MTTTLAVKPADQPDAPWQPLRGVTNVTATVDEQVAGDVQAFTDWASSLQATPLTEWQQTKLRTAFAHALLLARWVMARP